MSKAKLPLAWYHGTQEPQTLIIGPAGHDSKEWKELETVATPKERHGNPFYMEAECALVMNRHGLAKKFETKGTFPGLIHWERINYNPGAEVRPELFSPDFFKAYDEWRKEWVVERTKQ